MAIETDQALPTEVRRVLLSFRLLDQERRSKEAEIEQQRARQVEAAELAIRNAHESRSEETSLAKAGYEAAMREAKRDYEDSLQVLRVQEIEIERALTSVKNRLQHANLTDLIDKLSTDERTMNPALLPEANDPLETLRQLSKAIGAKSQELVRKIENYFALIEREQMLPISWRWGVGLIVMLIVMVILLSLMSFN